MTGIHELRQGRPFAPNGPTGAAGAANRSNDVLSAIDTMLAEHERRHAWLADAAAKIARWREEDRLNGQPWADDVSPERGPGRANNAPGDIR